jgi:hypothetical protein
VRIPGTQSTHALRKERATEHQADPTISGFILLRNFGISPCDRRGLAVDAPPSGVEKVTVSGRVAIQRVRASGAGSDREDGKPPTPVENTAECGGQGTQIRPETALAQLALFVVNR